jgi:hypothetical protein
MLLFMSMLKLNLKYLLRSNLNLNSFLLAFIAVLFVILDHTVIRFTLRSLGLRSMIPRKVRLVKNLPCLNMFPGKNLMSISMIVPILGKAVRGYFTWWWIFWLGWINWTRVTILHLVWKRLGLGRMIPFTPWGGVVVDSPRIRWSHGMLMIFSPFFFFFFFQKKNKNPISCQVLCIAYWWYCLILFTYALHPVLSISCVDLRFSISLLVMVRSCLREQIASLFLLLKLF